MSDVGDRAYRIELQRTRTVEGEDLGELAQRGRLLLVFLRHFG